MNTAFSCSSLSKQPGMSSLLTHELFYYFSRAMCVTAVPLFHFYRTLVGIYMTPPCMELFKLATENNEL